MASERPVFCGTDSGANVEDNIVEEEEYCLHTSTEENIFSVFLALLNRSWQAPFFHSFAKPSMCTAIVLCATLRMLTAGTAGGIFSCFYRNGRWSVDVVVLDRRRRSRELSVLARRDVAHGPLCCSRPCTNDSDGGRGHYAWSHPLLMRNRVAAAQSSSPPPRVPRVDSPLAIHSCQRLLVFALPQRWMPPAAVRPRPRLVILSSHPVKFRFNINKFKLPSQRQRGERDVVRVLIRCTEYKSAPESDGTTGIRHCEDTDIASTTTSSYFWLLRTIENWERRWTYSMATP